MFQQSNRKTTIQNVSRIMESSNHSETTVLQYAPDNDVRSMDNFYAQSMETSMYVLSIDDHCMMPSRDRFGSFDSFASASSAFSLAPRTSNPGSESRGFSPISEKKSPPKGIIVHPQSKGRPVLELVLDDIPDQLMVPTL